MKRISLFLALPALAKLRTLSLRTGLKMSELIRRACDEYLARQK